MISQTLILGVGNIYRGDDGIGPRVIEKLKSQLLSDTPVSDTNWDIIDGGIDGLALLDIIQQYSKAIIIDAVNMNEPPGTIKIFTPGEAKILIHSDALSTHGFGLAEVLALSQQLDIKTKIQIIGIQPQNIEWSETLTPKIASKIDDVIEWIRIHID